MSNTVDLGEVIIIESSDEEDRPERKKCRNNVKNISNLSKEIINESFNDEDLPKRKKYNPLTWMLFPSNYDNTIFEQYDTYVTSSSTETESENSDNSDSDEDNYEQYYSDLMKTFCETDDTKFTSEGQTEKNEIYNTDIFYTKDTIELIKKQILMKSKLQLNKNRQNYSPLFQNYCRKSCSFFYCKINELLSVGKLDFVPHVSLIGMFIKNDNREYVLRDVKWEIEIKLNFSISENVPVKYKYYILQGIFYSESCSVEVHHYQEISKGLIQKTHESLYKERSDLVCTNSCTCKYL